MLGIACTPVGADLRAKLGLQEDVGLVVDSVVEGTIASRIGLRAGDVVVELSGRSIRKREDVAEVLAERRAGEDLQVVIVDKDGKRRTLTHRN
jgi:S1-C subfamily serine protease